MQSFLKGNLHKLINTTQPIKMAGLVGLCVPCAHSICTTFIVVNHIAAVVVPLLPFYDDPGFSLRVDMSLTS